MLCGVGRADPVSYTARTAAGVRLHVITADLNDPRVRIAPALARNGVGTSESFGSFVSRLQPVAAVNGTFFSKRDLRPVGDILVAKQLVHFGGMGTAIAFANDGVDLIRLPSDHRVDWWEYTSALAAGPLLVWNGFPKPMPGGEGFGDPHVFAKAAPRSAVGVTADSKVLLVTTITGTSLGHLAKAMQEMGAVYAVNLDGGASCAMWYRGRSIKAAGRPLTNVLCVYVDSALAQTHTLRAPRGLDWRAGHKRPPSTGFRAGDLHVWIELPQTWEGEQTLRLSSNHSLPQGQSVKVYLNNKLVEQFAELPGAVKFNLYAINSPKHTLWIGVVDSSGRVLGRLEWFVQGRYVRD